MPSKQQKDPQPPKGKPALKVVGSASVSNPSVQAGGVFSDPRSGRDRREERGAVDDPRRVNGERRKTNRNKAWWLEKSYVDAHYFSETDEQSKDTPKE